MEYLLDEVKYCKKVMKKEFNKPLIMTKEDEEKFLKANECYICNKEYTDKDIKVRDHATSQVNIEDQHIKNAICNLD